MIILLSLSNSKLMVILLTLDKSRLRVILLNEGNDLTSAPLRKNWMPEYLSGLLIHATNTPLLKPVKVPPALSSNETTFGCVLLLIFQVSSFFPFSQHSLLGYLWVPTPVRHLYGVQDTMTCQQSPVASQHLPREADDFPMGDMKSRDVSLLT